LPIIITHFDVWNIFSYYNYGYFLKFFIIEYFSIIADD